MGLSKILGVSATPLLALAMSLVPVQIASAQSPSTTVLIPASGASVSGPAQILDAVASAGATQVQYEITGGTLTDSVVATGTATIYGWLAQWNTTSVDNGSYTLQSVATYSGGSSVASPSVTITVNNAPPSTAVVLPSGGATVSGTAQYFDATASPGVSLVHFVLTGGSLNSPVTVEATPTIYGWLAQWNTTSVPNGSYTLQSVATYAGGVPGTSPAITFTVDNPPPSTTVLIPASGADVDTTQTDVYDAIASAGATAVSFQVEVEVDPSSPTITTLTASPTIYGWIAVVAGNPCTTQAPKTCSYATVPGAVVSVANYANGMSVPSAPVDVMFFINTGIID